MEHFAYNGISGCAAIWKKRRISRGDPHIYIYIYIYISRGDPPHIYIYLIARRTISTSFIRNGIYWDLEFDGSALKVFGSTTAVKPKLKSPSQAEPLILISYLCGSAWLTDFSFGLTDLRNRQLLKPSNKTRCTSKPRCEQKEVLIVRRAKG